MTTSGDIDRSLRGPQQARTRRRRGAGAAIAALSALGLAAIPAMAASAAPVHPAKVTTFTWSGTDAAPDNGNNNWSDPNNWAGGVAPTSNSTIAVVFPALACQPTNSGCSYSNNDLTGLTISSFKTQADGVANDATPYNAYQIGGDQISLTGPFSTVVDQTDGTNTYGLVVSMPMVLAKAGTWTFDGGQAVFTGGVTGSAKLGVTVSHGGGFSENNSFDVGALTISGADKTRTGYATFGNGTFFVDGDVNGTDGSPVTAKNVNIYAIGTIGALTATGDNLQLGQGNDTAIAGAGKLAKTDTVPVFVLSPGNGSPQHPQDYPQLRATGKLTLGNAQLGLSADCGQSAGTTYTIVSAGKVSGTFGDSSGKAIKNNTVLSTNGDGSDSCSNGAAAPGVRINYTSTTVTLTVVATPQAAVAGRFAPAAGRAGIVTRGGVVSLAPRG